MEPSARPRFVRAKRVSGGSDDDDDDNDDDDETLPIAKLARELFAQLVPRTKKSMQCTRAFEANLRKNLGQALASLGKGIAALCQAGILDGVVAPLPPLAVRRHTDRHHTADLHALDVQLAAGAQRHLAQGGPVAVAATNR